MKKVDKNVLKEASEHLLFEMSEEEYDTLLKEFETVLKQMELIGQIPGVDKAKPMTFPYEIYSSELREDIPSEPLKNEEAMKNAHDVVEGQIRLPKVVN